MAKYKQLQKFKDDELIFDNNETKAVLKFIFNPTDHSYIESLNINNTIRGFAQALLVEAIDASYAVGFVEAIFRSTTNPTNGAIKILKKFAKKAALHWFKHATVTDLQNVKVYDFVRSEIARRFRSPLHILGSTAKFEKQPGAFLKYKKPSKFSALTWG